MSCEHHMTLNARHVTVDPSHVTHKRFTSHISAILILLLVRNILSPVEKRLRHLQASEIGMRRSYQVCVCVCVCERERERERGREGGREGGRERERGIERVCCIISYMQLSYSNLPKILINVV